ncbi:MAG: hypothetical protein WKF55_03570 [Gemmatimonadaceae bacterium]
MDDTSQRHPRASEIRDGVIGTILNAVQGMGDDPEEVRERIAERKRGLDVKPETAVWIEDLKTGEFLKSSLELRAPRQKRARSIGYFVRVSRKELYEMAINPPPRSARTVLDYLLATCDWNNSVDVRHHEIADAVNMKRPNVSRAIRWLIDATYLVVPPVKPNALPWMPGKRKRYWLNPDIFAFGDDKENAALQNEIEEYEREKQKVSADMDQLYGRGLYRWPSEKSHILLCITTDTKWYHGRYLAVEGNSRLPILVLGSGVFRCFSHLLPVARFSPRAVPSGAPDRPGQNSHDD